MAAENLFGALTCSRKVRGDSDSILPTETDAESLTHSANNGYENRPKEHGYEECSSRGASLWRAEFRDPLVNGKRRELTLSAFLHLYRFPSGFATNSLPHQNSLVRERYSGSDLKSGAFGSHRESNYGKLSDSLFPRRFWLTALFDSGAGMSMAL